VSIAFCAIRTRNRLDCLILLIPYWESYRADPEEKQGPASDIRHRSGKMARKRLTSSRRIERALTHWYYSHKPKYDTLIYVLIIL
jgi:hypothetical protein